jgi:hypothetical protein
MSEAWAVRYMARAAVADPDPGPGSLGHSTGGLLVLLVVMIRSVFKPRGLIPYGQPKQQHTYDRA